MSDWTPGQPPGPPMPPPGQPVPPPGQPAAGGRGGRRWTVNAGRLWAGGVAIAVVAALIAIVGILIARGIFGIPVLAPKSSGTWGDASTVTYAVVAFAAGLVATGIIHGLLLSTPSPFTFFGWILGLCTLAAALAPFAASGDLAPKITTAVINAVLGIAIWSLTASVAHRSMQWDAGALRGPTAPGLR